MDKETGPRMATVLSKIPWSMEQSPFLIRDGPCTVAARPAQIGGRVYYSAALGGGGKSNSQQNAKCVRAERPLAGTSQIFRASPPKLKVTCQLSEAAKDASHAAYLQATDLPHPTGFLLPLTSLALSNCSRGTPTASPVSSRISARLSLTRCWLFPFRPTAAGWSGGVL